VYEITTIGDVTQPTAPALLPASSSSSSVVSRASALIADVRAQRTGLIVGLVVGAAAVFVYKAVAR
jgi:hypothetical protein